MKLPPYNTDENRIPSAFRIRFRIESLYLNHLIASKYNPAKISLSEIPTAAYLQGKRKY